MMMASKTLRSVSGARWAVAILAFALVIVVALPLAGMADSGYRADTGSYNEEGFGLVAEYLAFTQVEYRADTGSYNEEGLGYLK